VRTTSMHCNFSIAKDEDRLPAIRTSSRRHQVRSLGPLHSL
jgi:hypothetical protein